jgi:transposase
LEGEHNALGEFGYNRDGKRGKLQIVIGLLTDREGEPLTVRVFAGNSADPVTVADQIRLVQEQFGVQELVFVGDRGMVKSKGRQALKDADLRYMTALTDPHTITLPDALASLSRLCLLHYPVNADTTVTRLPGPDVRQKQILTALGVMLPEK